MRWAGSFLDPKLVQEVSSTHLTDELKWLRDLYHLSPCVVQWSAAAVVAQVDVQAYCEQCFDGFDVTFRCCEVQRR